MAGPWVYRAKLVHVVDGDTVDLRVSRDADFGFRMQMELSAVVRFRLSGIDTPESRGPTRELGQQATAFLEAQLRAAAEIRVESLGEPDKYGGRWDATVSIRYADDPPAAPWVELGVLLVQLGYAKSYSGAGPRPSWDPAQRYPRRLIS